MTIKCITEVAIAVRSLEDAVAQLVAVFGATPGEVLEFADYGMKFCMCRVGQIDFEVMAPSGEDGVIADFIRKRGEGLHHIAFAVDDAKGVQRALTAMGMEFVNEQPQKATYPTVDFDGVQFHEPSTFTFVKPSSFMGVLLEFVEYPTRFRLPP